MLAAVETSRYIERVQAEYPVASGNNHDLLINFFARAIVCANEMLDKKEELTFHRVLGILTEECPEDIATDNPPEIVKMVLSNWPEVNGDEDAQEVIIRGVGRYQMDMVDFTRAWNLVSSGARCTQLLEPEFAAA